MGIEYTKPTSTRFTPSQRVIVETAAGLKGLTLAAWLRATAVEAAWTQVDATRPEHDPPPPPTAGTEGSDQ